MSSVRKVHALGDRAGIVADATAVAGRIVVARIEAAGERPDKLDVGPLQVFAAFAQRGRRAIETVRQIVNLPDGRGFRLKYRQDSGGFSFAKARHHGGDRSNDRPRGEERESGSGQHRAQTGDQKHAAQNALHRSADGIDALERAQHVAVAEMDAVGRQSRGRSRRRAGPRIRFAACRCPGTLPVHPTTPEERWSAGFFRSVPGRWAS